MPLLRNFWLYDNGNVFADRTMSLVNGGRDVEDDLFAGLRGYAQSQSWVYVTPELVVA